MASNDFSCHLDHKRSAGYGMATLRRPNPPGVEMIYVASPYSSPILEAQQQRFEAAREFTRRAFKLGFAVFSPIVYAHEMARGNALPTDAQSWLVFNSQVLRHAEAMYVLRLTGWEKSKGVTTEIKQCTALFIPIVYYEAQTDGKRLRFPLSEASAQYRGVLVEEF